MGKRTKAEEPPVESPPRDRQALIEQAIMDALTLEPGERVNLLLHIAAMMPTSSLPIERELARIIAGVRPLLASTE